MLYEALDRLFDPVPKEVKKRSDYSGKVLYYQSQDEGYRRYKHRCYRNLLIETAVSLLLGFIFGFLIKVL